MECIFFLVYSIVQLLPEIFNKSNLAKHIKKANCQKFKLPIIQNCKLCNKEFSSKDILKKHISSDHKEVCIKRKKLIKNVHDGSNEYMNYECKLCDSKIEFMSNKFHLIKKHFKDVHEIERNHICAICDIDFQSHPELRNHTIENQ